MKRMLAILLCAVMALSLTVATAQEETPLRVALCIAETLGDLGFYDSADSGLQMLVDDYGVTGSVVECKADASKYQPLLVEAAENNDIVVAVGWQFWDALTAVVPEMPDTKFIFVDNGLDGLGDNLMSIVYAENEGSFLAGYIAMKQSQTATVGFVGGEDSDTINNFFVGYKQGALYANPDGKVLDPGYVGDYESPDKGKEFANDQYAKGADVVFAVAGKTGLGVFEAAKEQGKYAIGVDSDQKYIDPDTIICSMKKEVGSSIYDAVKRLLDGDSSLWGTTWVADMSNGYVGIGYGEDGAAQQVPDDVKNAVEELSKKIVSGEITVETTR